MPVFVYGKTRFDWIFQLDDSLRHHYVTVERGQPVILRGPLVPLAEQEALVRQRARWIREKLVEVNQREGAEVIVTGSRLRYRGRSYYTEVRHSPGLKAPQLRFTESRFIIDSPDGHTIEGERLGALLERFYREKAVEKLFARVRYWERQTGLQATGARLHRFQSRWASCSEANLLEFHPRCMELSQAVLDYVIVHELCHTVEKNHTKAFWRMVLTWCPDAYERHEVLQNHRVASL